MNNGLTRKDFKFIAFVVGLILAATIPLIRVDTKVNGIMAREQNYKTAFLEMEIKLNRIINNQIQIATHLGLEIER